MNSELKRKARGFFLWGLVLVLFLVRWQSLPRLKLDNHQLIRLKGRLSQEPQVFDNRQSFKLGQFRVYTYQHPQFHYGQELEIVGKVEKSAGVVPYLLSYPQITLLRKSQNPGGITGWAIGLNQRLKKIYQQAFPQPWNGIVAGVVLGDKSLLPLDFWKKLQASGTLHIMVASGMNIAFLAGNCLSLLALFFKRPRAIFFLFVLIWFYTLMTGLAPPVVRAAIMASLIYLAQVLGRPTQAARLLFFSGALMLFFEPFLIFDWGFQLSFLATAGLVFFQPLLQTQKYWLLRQENFASTLAAQITTLPILVLNFGQLNLISPLINLAVLWLIPFVLQAGIVIGLLGLLSKALAQAASYLLYPALFLIEQTVSQTVKLKIFQVQFPVLSPWLGLGYYLILALWLKTRSKTRKRSHA